MDPHNTLLLQVPQATHLGLGRSKDRNSSDYAQGTLTTNKQLL